MPTLGDMKAHLADDLDETGTTYTAAIARAITRAIEHYKKTRFAFNVSRTITFPTVADQADYDESDETDIPNIIKIDGLFLTDSSGEITDLRPISPQEMEILLDNSASSGEPYAYCYFANAFRIYPMPDAVYTMTVMAWYRLDEPAADGDSNAWTEEAYDLIKSRALFYLATNTTRDADLAMAAKRDELEAEDALVGEANAKYGTGYIAATSF